MPELSLHQREQPPEAALAALAGSQFGVVSVEQLRGLGVSHQMIWRRVRTGRWRRIHRGVVRVGHATTDLRARAWGAQLACGPDAVVSHHTAAALWNLVKDHPGPVHITLPQSRRNRPGLHFHESRSPNETRIWYGLRITTPIRTLVDLADHVTTDELERALSEAHRLGYVDRHATDFGRHPGRKGLTRVLKRGARMTRSQIERRFLRDLRADSTVPLPLTNERLYGYEADCYWPDHGLVVEIDVYATHGDRLAFERDRRKQTAYALHGIMILRITDETLPGAIAAVRRLISDRSGRL